MRPLTGSILPYSLSAVLNPTAANTLGSRDLFRERRKYQDVPYFLDLPEPLHSWYDKLYYGRVDPIQNPIFLMNNSNYLKQFATERGNYFALSFVVDAFKDLQQHLLTAADAGVISTTSFYYKIEAAGGLARPIPAYQKIRDEWGDIFLGYLKANPQVMRRVVDLESYIKEALNYMRRNVNPLPLTMSGFVLSNFSSPMISGLSVELVTDNYANDFNKFANYIQDPNFKYFVKAARQFGFYVDRNGPWKLTAATPAYPMSHGPTVYPREPQGDGEVCAIPVDPSGCGGADTYMGNYGLDMSNFFDTCYYRAFQVDLQILQGSLRYLYNLFAQNYPIVERRRSTTPTYRIGSAYRTSVSTATTNIMRRSAAAGSEQALGDIYWLNVYFKIRLHETSLKAPQYDVQFKEITDVYRNFGMQHATRHINNLVKPYLYNSQLGKRGLTTGAQPVTIGTIGDVPAAPGTTRGGTGY